MKANPTTHARTANAQINAMEATTLFDAIVLAHDVTGDIPTGLRLMLEKRLRLVVKDLTISVNLADIPF